MVKIAPSILTANFCNIGDTIRMLGHAGADWIHLDIMDNAFVPNMSFGQSTVRDVRKITALPLDVHLMLVDPNPYLEEFAQVGADHITVHMESPGCVHIQRTLKKIRALHKRAGICLNPGTPHEALEYLYEDVDIILLMSVNPGYGGQAFIPQTLRKIEAVANRAAQLGLSVDIEVDGGIHIENAQTIIDAGATALVAGHAVVDAADPAEAIRLLRSKE